MSPENINENKIDEVDLTRKTYDLQGVKYSTYEGNNRFYGTPIPEGYEAIYQEDPIFPPSLILKKIKE
jgi:hypothetical protein